MGKMRTKSYHCNSYPFRKGSSIPYIYILKYVAVARFKFIIIHDSYHNLSRHLYTTQCILLTHRRFKLDDIF